MRLVRRAGLLAGLVCLASVVSPHARAADTVIAGAVGSAGINLWPVYVGMEKGLFAAEDLKIDLVFAQSNANVHQQLTAGSVDISVGSGLVGPIRAIEKGAALAIVRIDTQRPPYALLAKPAIKTLKDLKGKIVSLGGATDITRIFFEQMIASAGLQPRDVDMIYAGATSARLSALQSGAADAAILTSPQNYHAEAAGFTNLGLASDYSDMPFSGVAMNRTWASKNMPTARKFLSAYTKSVLWLVDPAHRAEAVDIMVKVSRLKPDDVEKSYDFLLKGDFYERTGKVSKSRLAKVVEALQQLGDVPATFKIDNLLAPELGQVTD